MLNLVEFVSPIPNYKCYIPEPQKTVPSEAFRLAEILRAEEYELFLSSITI